MLMTSFVGRTWDEPVDLRDPFREIAPNKKIALSASP